VTTLPPGASLKARNVRKKQSEPYIPPAEISSTPAKKGGESKALRIARAAFGVALVASIASTVAWGARHYVRTSPRFGVSEIITTGARHRSPEELAVTAGIAKGQNVFTTDLDRARARLLADPWISDATLGRQLPGTLFVHVVERQAAGLLATNEGTYVVQRDGSVIKKVEPGDPTDLHVVTGIRVQQLVEDREGATRTIARALDLGADYDRSPLAAAKPLEEIHVENNGEMTLVVGKNAITIKLGAAPYRRKIEQAVRVVAELDRRGAKPDAIMLDNDSRPDRVVVRVR
jgi:cell division protein FtsQ